MKCGKNNLISFCRWWRFITATSAIAFNERVTSWRQQFWSLPCALCVYAALFSHRLAYNHNPTAHAYNAENTSTQGSDQACCSQKSYSFVEGNRTIALRCVATMHPLHSDSGVTALWWNLLKIHLNLKCAELRQKIFDIYCTQSNAGMNGPLLWSPGNQIPQKELHVQIYGIHTRFGSLLISVAGILKWHCNAMCSDVVKYIMFECGDCTG